MNKHICFSILSALKEQLRLFLTPEGTDWKPTDIFGLSHIFCKFIVNTEKVNDFTKILTSGEKKGYWKDMTIKNTNFSWPELRGMV